MSDFFSHPFWPLLIFGFLLCPRILLFTLWWPLEVSLGAVISHPILTYLGFVIAPRLTIAFIFAGFYWQSNEVLVVISFLIALSGESFEKWGLRRFTSRRGGWQFYYNKKIG